MEQERLEYVERALEDLRQDGRELRESVRHLDTKVDGFRSELSGRIESLDQKVGALGAKIDGQFKWIVGLQFGFAVTIVGAVVGALFAIR